MGRGGYAPRTSVSPDLVLDCAYVFRFATILRRRTGFAGDLVGKTASNNVRFNLGGTMKIIGRVVLAAVAASGLAFATTGPAAAVGEHSHCLLTPTGYVSIAEGVSWEAPHDPALHNFHEYVHWGQPGREFLGMVISVPKGAECPPPPPERLVAATE
jgi:hypothetical protein